MFNLKKLLLFLFLIISCCNLYAQGRVLKGKITIAKDGTPLPGALIVIKGTTNGTAAGPDGLFSLSIPNGPVTIEVRSIGFFSKDVIINVDQNKINVALDEDNKQLSEVVVTGYSTQKKGNLTSAITVVSAEKLKDVTSDDIGEMLQGKVAGLQVVNSSGAPGSQSEIRLRGVSSVNAAQAPLIVVDGIIGGDYDPNDVESVTVLKDAGATAIYGSQANGGVIIITTKKAKGDKTQYEFKAVTGFRTPDFGSMTMMNSSELYQNQKQLFRDYIPGTTGNSYVIDLVQFQSERPASILNNNTNWLTTLFKPAPVENYYFSAMGKTTKNDYYFGATFYDEGGTFMNTDYKRINLRSNNTYHFTDKITLTNNINISGSEGKSYDYNDIYYAYLNLPWDNPYDANHNPIYVDGNSKFQWWSRDKTNPVNTIDNSDHPFKTFDINYDLALNLPITSWLTFNTTNRGSASYGYSSTFYSPEVQGTYHGSGYLNDQSTYNYGGISTNLMKFDFKLGKSAINGLAGVEFEGSQTNTVGASGQGLPLGLESLDVVSTKQAINGAPDSPSILSYLSQVNYSYDERYFLSGSYRVDGSSAFAPGNKYGSFPSVSAGWLASNEDFLKDNHTIDNLKLRLSYGITGTQDIGAARYLGLYSLTSQYNSATSATPLQLESPNLTWESKHQLDAGFDIGLFHRINITVDAYHNVTKNLLLQVAQPLSVGFESKWENSGEVLNNGLEFAISSQNIKNKDFQWTTDFNISFNNNKLQDFPSTVVSTGEDAVSQIYRTGGNLYEFYMPTWAGVNAQTGAPQWLVVNKDANGKVTSTSVTSNYASATLQEQGSALPKFQGGFNNEFKYKKFFLRINTYFEYGNKVYNANLAQVENDGSEPLLNQIVLPKGSSVWTHPGDIATEPSPENNANSTSVSTRYLKNGSYLSLRNIAFGYSLPKTFAQKLKLSDINLSLSADNVYTFTRYLGQDPATTITPGNFVTPGVADFKYPDNRQFLLNINVKF
ncbi:TonB-linked SusC/RagA family outer membrane protein [Mucilaginibacter frigoritolerans]|uniref:TonB-linked SusC/RagA family outer membrane protein n=1 Tax=Mucilaginibacter frigoritolerans TaxID=652788 RepID=A0A562UDY1_9SPHI|nr:SusC/RagA family TonB-linked outer membrane protein [Mucilaginibacter frigoritolerans]TWJ03615.1 TonB-linked SusC/RagA family outer membrane protein [Mucilaginibacter frigoritolerans]